MVEAETKYDMENKKLKELKAKCRDANNVQQTAYVHLQSLRKKLHVKVENFMELWNTNEAFRKECVKFNQRSTIRRLGTLDGRSLGPNEKPPVLPERVDNKKLVSQIPILGVKQETSAKTVTSADKMLKKATETALMNGSGSAYDLDLGYEEPKKSREEIEAIKEAVEKESQEAEAKLKEEREKKRREEKLEQKEKKREKRLRKKARAATDTNYIDTYETAPTSESCVEISKESEVDKDVFGKQGETKTVRSPLRYQNEKKLQHSMWMGVTSVVILVLFWLGNILGVFSNVNFNRRSLVI